MKTIALVCCLVLSGCSVFFHPEVDTKWKPKQGAPYCYKGDVAIAFDIMAAIGNGFLAMVATAAALDAEERMIQGPGRPSSYHPFIAYGIVIGTLRILSASAGVGRGRACVQQWKRYRAFSIEKNKALERRPFVNPFTNSQRDDPDE